MIYPDCFTTGAWHSHIARSKIKSGAYYHVCVACKHTRCGIKSTGALQCLWENVSSQTLSCFLITTCRKTTVFWQKISWEKQVGWSCVCVCVCVGFVTPMSHHWTFRLCITHVWCVQPVCVMCAGIHPTKQTCGSTVVWHGWRWFSGSALWAWQHPHRCRWSAVPPARHGWCSPHLPCRGPPPFSPQTPWQPSR